MRPALQHTFGVGVGRSRSQMENARVQLTNATRRAVTFKLYCFGRAEPLGRVTTLNPCSL